MSKPNIGDVRVAQGINQRGQVCHLIADHDPDRFKRAVICAPTSGEAALLVSNVAVRSPERVFGDMVARGFTKPELALTLLSTFAEVGVKWAAPMALAIQAHILDREASA